MAFETINDLECDTTTALGGKNNKTGKSNPKSIEGYYLGAREVANARSKTGKSLIHVFQTENGNVGVWGKTNMDQKLNSSLVGIMVRVTFTGMMALPGKNPMYKYAVEADRENTIEVSSPNVQATSDDEDYQEENANAEESADDEDYEESEVDSDGAEENAPPVKRPKAPQAPAKAPDAARQAKVNKLLGGSRSA